MLRTIRGVKTIICVVLVAFLAAGFVTSEVHAAENDSGEEVKMVLPEGMDFGEDEEETEKPKMCGYRRAKSGSFLDHENEGVLAEDDALEGTAETASKVNKERNQKQEFTVTIVLMAATAVLTLAVLLKKKKKE